MNYKDGKVSIPNKELMDKFAEMIQKEASPGYVYRLEQRRYTGRIPAVGISYWKTEKKHACRAEVLKR